MSDVAFFGAGAFGTALAVAASRGGGRVTLWGRDAGFIAEMAEKRENARYLPGVSLPENLALTADATQAAAAAALVLAVPTQALAEAAAALAPHIRAETPVIAAAKGIERTTGRFVTEILRDCLPRARPAILSGPSFAADIGRALPTAVTMAAQNNELAQRLATLLSGPGLRIYHSDDIRGVEIGGAAKNVLAIAAGIVAGAGLGESARAALVARGFAELRRFASALGARADTLMGLSGLGDLVLTASSRLSRNFAFGIALGEGADPATASAGSKLAEGVFTAPALVKMARERGVEMPIAEAVAAVLDGRISVARAVAGLIERPQKSE